MFPCSFETCIARFGNKKSLYEHSRAHQPHARVKFRSGLTATLHRTADNGFKCPDCEFFSSTPKGIQRHCLGCKKSAVIPEACPHKDEVSDTDSASQKLDPIPPFLICDKALSLLGLAFHRLLGAVVCMSPKCMCVVLVTGISDHVLRNHHGKLDKKQIQEAVVAAEMFINETKPANFQQYKEPTSTLLVPVPGFATLAGFMCERCAIENKGICFAKMKSLQAHHRNVHAGLGLCSKPCTIQRIFKVAKNVYFPVIARTQATSFCNTAESPTGDLWISKMQVQSHVEPITPELMEVDLYLQHLGIVAFRDKHKDNVGVGFEILLMFYAVAFGNSYLLL